MSKKSSQGERQWPSTQQMLLDHLRRIVEGVDCATWGDPPNECWYFGGGRDRLVSCVDEEDDHQASVEDIDSSAKIEMFLTNLAVEARDRPSGGLFKQDCQTVIEVLSECFEDRPNPRELFRRALPNSADTEALQKAYAFEMLNKLDQVVDRSKQKAVQEMLLLKNVPGEVDDYMAEAAACFRYGFDKACLAVCRTALEESLKRRIVRDLGRNSIRTLDSRGKEVDKGLFTLIEEAHKQYGYLNDPLARDADQIRVWGNGAVHGDSRDNIPRGVVKSRAQKALLQSKRILRRLWSGT